MSQADEIRLLKMINEQQAARIREQEETITQLRAVIGELRLPFSLSEYKRHPFSFCDPKEIFLEFQEFNGTVSTDMIAILFRPACMIVSSVYVYSLFTFILIAA